MEKQFFCCGRRRAYLFLNKDSGCSHMIQSVRLFTIFAAMLVLPASGAFAQSAPDSISPTFTIPTAQPNSAPTPPPAAPASTSESGSLMESLSRAIPGLTNQGSEADQMAAQIDPVTQEVVEVEKTPEEVEAELRGKAYESMMKATLPMTPPELRDAFERIDINQKAIEEPLAYPKPEVSFTTISLDPGATPLTFKLATGHVTTVSFLDVTGQPWPIKDVTWAGNFDVKSSSDGSSDSRFPSYPNLMQIIPMSEYAYGNMVVRLVGLATPATFTLRTNREVVQYRLDLRVPENGPLALPPIINTASNTLEAGDTTLTRIMEGILPSSAQKMSVEGADGRTTAYQVDGSLYVRTPLTLLSPGWTGSVKSADGMNVYALDAVPVLLLSDQGQMVRASLSETKGNEK